jgi:hypothetical protein
MSIGGKKAPDKDIYPYIYLLLVSCRQSRFLVEAAFFYLAVTNASSITTLHC